MIEQSDSKAFENRTEVWIGPCVDFGDKLPLQAAAGKQSLLLCHAFFDL